MATLPSHMQMQDISETRDRS